MYCATHDLAGDRGSHCPLCRASRLEAFAERLQLQSQRLDQQFELVMVLESRIADLEARQLRQRQQMLQLIKLHREAEELIFHLLERP